MVAAANAIRMVPVAMALAAGLRASPYPLAIMVALAHSSAFMTPTAPPSAMVVTADGHGSADFVRLGLPFTLIMGLDSAALGALALSVLLRRRHPRDEREPTKPRGRGQGRPGFSAQRSNRL